MREVYSFRIAYTSEDELKTLQESTADPNDLVLKILPDGQPSFKTLYAAAESEEQAYRKMEKVVSTTLYRDLPDGKLI